MSLRSKTLCVLIGIFALYEGLDYGVQHLVIYPGFEAVERSEARMDANRCVEAIGREGHHLDRLCQDWAAWDDAYKFAVDKNDAFIKSCLPVETFKENRLNLVYFFDARGQRVWSRIYDRAWTVIALKNASDDAFLADLVHPARAKIPGILTTPWGPMLVAARDITTSDHSGTPRGTLIMGKFLGEDLIGVLKDQTCVNFKLWPLGAKALPAAERAAAAALATDPRAYYRERDARVLAVYTLIPDVHGTPVLLLRADIPREITAMGRVTRSYALYSILLVGLTVVLVMLLLLQRIIIGPISELTGRIIRIARSNDLSLRIPLEYGGEIDSLAREFNAMLQQLSHSRQKLLEESYYAGLAEMTSGTMRDVRDALNPLLIQIERLRDKVLAAGESGDGKDRLDVMHAQARQIRTILAEHEQLRGAERPTETLALGTLLRESTDLVSDRLLQILDVEIDFDPEQTPPVLGCRILLLQVLASLFINAAEAVLRAGLTRGRINIAVSTEWTRGREMVHLKFLDNGDGIEPVRLAAIFEREAAGRRPSRNVADLGLRWCADVLAGMNGCIYAESEGKGRGACFHVLLPIGTPAPIAGA